MFNIQNRRYLGNKYKILPFIKETIEKECGEFETFFDVFAGTGVVSSGFLDKKLILNALLYSNHICHIAWFKNESYSKEKLQDIIKYYNSIQQIEKENYMSINFKDTYYSDFVCKKIGYIREDIENKFKCSEINEKERAILITSLLYSMDKIANTCGHYDAFFKNKKDLPQDIELQMLDIPDIVLKDNLLYNTDSNVLAKNIQCDIAYLDPPYNSRQYSDAYHLLENVAKWEKKEVFGVAKKINRDHIKSEYCRSNATETFRELINNLNCKYIILSYNNTGLKANDRSNAKISDEDIIKILSKKGTVKIFSKKHKAFTTGKSDNQDNEERLFICKVNFQQKDDIIYSPLNYIGGKGKLLPQILPHFPSQIDTFVDLFCGGCNVGINVSANKYIYNDIDAHIIDLFNFFKTINIDDFISKVEKTIKRYNLSNSSQNGYSFYGCTGGEGLGNYNKNYFLNLRNDFNNHKTKDEEYFILFYTIILFSFNNQIRFNSKGEFNLPVGKRDFNDNMKKKLKVFVTKLQKQDSTFVNNDFSKVSFPQNSFVYIDPPYLISNATYNEKNQWNEDKEKELLNFIDSLLDNGIPFALSNVLHHKGKTNDILCSWCEKNKNKINVIHLNFNYNNCNYQTTTKEHTDEVLIIYK